MGEKLGQNFLKDKSVVDKIIKASNLTEDDFVMEIGPGEGILTAELAKCAGKVLAIEIDRNLIPQLKNKFREQKNVEIIEGDILKINIPELISKLKIQSSNQIQNSKFKIKNCGYKVVANIPYYITSKIVRLFLETEFPPQEMILMVQKEVAERIAAKPGEMSILAISVQYYAEAEILFNVSRENFNPIPEVNSSVIKISSINGQRSKVKSQMFFRIVKAGFCARRKTLANNLANSLHLDKKEVEEKLLSLNVKPTVRAQELSVEDWKKLAELFN